MRFLIDAYRKGNKIILWVKENEKNIRIEKEFESHVYLSLKAKEFLERENIPHSLVKRKTYYNTIKDVYDVAVVNLSKFVRDVEKEFKHKLVMFDADIIPEQMFLYKNNLVPFCCVDENLNFLKIDTVQLKEVNIEVDKKLKYNGKEVSDEEFLERFKQDDPDVIRMPYAFSKLPELSKRLNYNFHRWDATDIKYIGGKSYYSYGQVRYQDFAYSLRGRLLVDSCSMVGSYCSTEAIVELCQLSGCLFQKLAPRSFGAVFQSSLVREMVRSRLMVPFKQKPVDRPMNMLDFLKSDRAGHTLDPKIGFHKDVAQIDFSSMYPWLIYNHNISAETVLSKEGPFENVPGIPVRVSLRHKGLVPRAIKPFLDRRMYYKKNPSSVNNEKAVGLKWVLVTSYGYLRFREFKLGLASSHMAICSYAREALLKSMHLAEEKGYEVVHGIVDCLFIKKKGITEEEVKDFCRELEALVGVPCGFDGIYKWVVLLPSVIDFQRPVPARYYGVFTSGDVKARGIEVRQHSSCMLVRDFQEKVLSIIKNCPDKKEIVAMFPFICKLFKKYASSLDEIDHKYLECRVRVSKTDYKHKIAQAVAVLQLKKKGVDVKPGMVVRFIYSSSGVVLAEDFKGNVDVVKYRKFLLRSLRILQPFGFITENVYERQSRLEEFCFKVTEKYVPMRKEFFEKRGLSEKEFKRVLEKDGWIVWRGGSIGVQDRDEVYPNVYKKYELLKRLLGKRYCQLKYINSVHHGMPDFICYRHQKFKFVECKLQYESLSDVQKRCITKLQNMGYLVEVCRLMKQSARFKVVHRDVNTGKRIILEKQLKVI
ncbi:MAG: VRR-NUC domain-containing protein [Nanoarchaeota archaeon]|nr:VRR-NUC domain-containing protein [Nanoarchaeota archaeon]MBU1704498.1 VRR-NUC domain-containing protein [Nanoarchaeota archaeon]